MILISVAEYESLMKLAAEKNTTVRTEIQHKPPHSSQPKNIKKRKKLVEQLPKTGNNSKLVWQKWC